MHVCQGTWKLHGRPLRSACSSFVSCMHVWSVRTYACRLQQRVVACKVKTWCVLVAIQLDEQQPASLASGCLLGCIACTQVSHCRCYSVTLKVVCYILQQQQEQIRLLQPCSCEKASDLFSIIQQTASDPIRPISANSDGSHSDTLNNRAV